MGAKFEIYKDKAGEFRFRLKAGNGEVIATGESYKAKAGCKNGIESVKKNAADAKVEIIDKAEEEVMAFLQMETQQQYWLAKALILLSDINLSRGEDFQARQYLITLQNNYRGQDDILSIVADKIRLLDSLQQPKQEEEKEEEL